MYSTYLHLHGIKSDYHRQDFEVGLRLVKDDRVDPIKALKCYIEHTRYVRSESCPLFLCLKRPNGAIKAKTITQIFEKSIILVGLMDLGNSAKCFRPSGDVSAVESGVN